MKMVGLNRNRDLYIMDQRGNKDTHPELTCPEIDEFNIKVLDYPTTLLQPKTRTWRRRRPVMIAWSARGST